MVEVQTERVGMTSANACKRLSLCTLLIAGLIGFSGAAHAQSHGQNGVGAAAHDDEANGAFDRGKARLNLLINLVENEYQEAKLKQSRLTAEASRLDQQQRSLHAGPSSGTEAEKQQLKLIKQRLEQIDKEVAAVNTRLPEISAELAELQARLDEANGIVRESDAGPIILAHGGQWPDSKHQIQEALVYLGGYNGVIDGDFGPRTQAAIRVFQESQDLDASGTLAGDQETLLLEEAERHRTRYGMTRIEDKSEGYRITYPGGLLSEDTGFESPGRRYVSEDGEGELVITSSVDTVKNQGELSELFNSLLSEKDVQYRRKRQDWFVVAGPFEEGRIVYETARLNGNRLVRATLSYPADWRDVWSPFAVILFNTFEALPAGQS